LNVVLWVREKILFGKVLTQKRKSITTGEGVSLCEYVCDVGDVGDVGEIENVCMCVSERVCV